METRTRPSSTLHEGERAKEGLVANERGFELIIDTMPALVWSARPDGSADFFNRHYLDFIGLSSDQASGRGWTAAVHPEDLISLAATWEQIMASGAPGEAEARLRRHDGDYRWFLFRTSPLRDADGAIVKWYGVNTDIEDRKRAEVELKRAYDSFADAQRLSRTGNFTADIAVDEHIWSDELYRIFELDPATKISVQMVRDIIHPDDLAVVRFRLRAVAGGRGLRSGLPHRPRKREREARSCCRPSDRARRGPSAVHRCHPGRDRADRRRGGLEPGPFGTGPGRAGHDRERTDRIDRA